MNWKTLLLAFIVSVPAIGEDTFPDGAAPQHVITAGIVGSRNEAIAAASNAIDKSDLAEQAICTCESALYDFEQSLIDNDSYGDYSDDVLAFYGEIGWDSTLLPPQGLWGEMETADQDRQWGIDLGEMADDGGGNPYAAGIPGVNDPPNDGQMLPVQLYGHSETKSGIATTRYNQILDDATEDEDCILDRINAAHDAFLGTLE